MHFASFGFYQEDGWKFPIIFFAFQISACIPAIMRKVCSKPMHIESMIGETSWKENTNFPACCELWCLSPFGPPLRLSRDMSERERNNGFSQIAPNFQHTKTSQPCFFWMLAAQVDNWFCLWHMVRCMYGMETTIYTYKGVNLDIHRYFLAPFQYTDYSGDKPTWLLIVSSNKRIIVNILTTKLKINLHGIIVYLMVSLGRGVQTQTESLLYVQSRIVRRTPCQICAEKDWSICNA